MGRGAQVSLGIAEARGAALSIDYGVPVHYLAPRRAKVMVAGNGNADKNAVLEAVMRLLGCQEITYDEADAAAVALAASGFEVPRSKKK